MKPDPLRGDKTGTRATVLLFALAALLCCQLASGSCNIEAGQALNISGDVVSWDITNYGNSPVTICGVSLAWPEENGRLVQVRLGDDVISSREVEWSRSTAAISNWDGGAAYRTIGQGQTRTLGLRFNNDTSFTSSSQYNLSIAFCECCIIQFRPGGAPRCNLIGGCNLSIDRKDVSWNITNRGNTPVTISSIAALWPEDNGRLLKVMLGDEVISSKGTAWSGTPVIISSWDGSAKGRTIGQGQTEMLKLSFERDATGTDPGQYGINVGFFQNCDVRYRPGPPICYIVAGDMELNSTEKSARLEITNWGNSPITICQVRIGTPAEHGDLRLVKVDGDEIFSGDRAPPEMVVSDENALWSGGRDRRMIGQGQTGTLKFFFDKNASGRYYPLRIDFLRVDFCPCFVEIYPAMPATCARQCTMCDYYSESFKPSGPPMCGILGPDAICNNTEGLYTSSLFNVPDKEGYTYLWSVDGGEGQVGSQFSLIGSSYSEGDHMLQLSVKDGDRDICNCSKIVNISTVPSFYIVQVVRA